jgi:hypothetical protein
MIHIPKISRNVILNYGMIPPDWRKQHSNQETFLGKIHCIVMFNGNWPNREILGMTAAETHHPLCCLG